ncbi:MAG: hypothetical protein MRZ79_23025 [Bacteroidia bacterium]|nr:hypothetical protein [Bacteroidia bacterium]
MKIYLLLAFSILGTALYAQNNQQLHEIGGTDRPLLHYSGMISQDLSGNGKLQIRIQSDDTSKIAKDHFNKLVWFKFMSGKTLVLEQLQPASALEKLKYQNRYYRDFLFRLNPVQVKQLKELPLLYFHQMKFEKDSLRTDTIRLKDPWTFSKPSYKFANYWSNKNLELFGNVEKAKEPVLLPRSNSMLEIKVEGEKQFQARYLLIVSEEGKVLFAKALEGESNKAWKNELLLMGKATLMKLNFVSGGREELFIDVNFSPGE